eukprot:4173153-Prymnesium_polylepis.1
MLAAIGGPARCCTGRCPQSLLSVPYPALPPFAVSSQWLLNEKGGTSPFRVVMSERPPQALQLVP